MRATEARCTDNTWPRQPPPNPPRPTMELDPDTLLFWLKKLVAVLALPPVLPLLPIVIGLITLRRRPRLGLALAWAGVALNLLLIFPPSVGWLVARVEYPQMLDRARAREAQAIVRTMPGLAGCAQVGNALRVLLRRDAHADIAALLARAGIESHVTEVPANLEDVFVVATTPAAQEPKRAAGAAP